MTETLSDTSDKQSTRRQQKLFVRAMLIAALCGAGVLPLVILGVQALFGTPHVGEVFGGAAFGVAFLGVTSLVTAVFLGSSQLRLIVIALYISKCCALTAFMFTLRVDNYDLPSIAMSIAFGAFVFVCVQAIVVTRTSRANQTMKR